MGKKSILLIFIFLFSLTFVLAESIPQRQDADLNEAYIISQPCATCSYVNISVYNKQGIVLDNVAMTNNGTSWIYEFTPTLKSRHDVNGVGDINGQDDSFAFFFEVDGLNIIAYTLILLFFLALIFTYHHATSKINYDRWYKSILNKYEKKNAVKMVISSIGYNFMKNRFIWYYLFGLPIILLITDIAYTFGVGSMNNLLQILLSVYYWGFLVVGVYFFGFIQEWIVALLKDISDLNWGIGK